MKKRCIQDDSLWYKNHLKKMKRKRENLKRNQISKLFKIRSHKDIWSFYNQMSGKSQEDGNLYLNTETGDTTNDSKKCASQLAKALHTEVERLRNQSEPKNKPLFNIETIPRPMIDTSIKIRNDIHNARNSRRSETGCL
jgi:hypothetical protein